MMVQLKIKHERKFIMSQLKIECFVFVEISTKYTFIVHLQVDN